MKTPAVLVFSALIFGSVANAGPTQLPGAPGSPYIGTGIPVQAGWWISGSDSLNGGGAFNSYVSPGTPNASVNTAFWCVDDQTYFYPVENGTANIFRLSDLGTTAPYNETWYGSSSPGWTNSGIDGLSASDTVQTRLEMAAYLVQQYGGYLPFTTITGAPSHGTNLDVQEAIWAITNNSTFSSSHNPGAGYHDPTPSGVAYWINQAATNYQHVSASEWALVTWDVNSDGSLAGTTSSRQSFLVSLAPEPGFYGILSLGMGGLAFAISRKRKSA